MIMDKSKQNSFLKDIENYVLNENTTYIEAVLSIGEKYKIEPEVSAKYLSKPIIEKIENEGIDINLLPKNTAILPL
jgi:hypothetical protein|tara:strand:- start:4521 stop:4748 length:228 start_codon:yes stop_codon:yes gene_type:complete